MDYELSTPKDSKPKADIILDDDELFELRNADYCNNSETVAAMGRAAGNLLREADVTGDFVIVSPLYSLGFSVDTCYEFLGAVRSVPGLEMDSTN